jgi:hypothetical protein
MAKAKSSSSRAVVSSQSPFGKFSPLTQDLLCVALLYVITLFVFRGIIFGNAAFASQGDTSAAASYAHAGEMIRQAEGVDVLWMPFFFSGMPTFGNVAYIPHDVNYLQTVVTSVLNLFYLNGTWTWMVVFYFLAGMFMFLLARVWTFGHVASLIAALTFMLSPYAIGLAGGGHGSKLMALSYLPLTVLLTHMLFQRRDLLSFGLLCAGVGTLLLTNHMQIVYYVFIVVGFYLLYQIVLDYRDHRKLIPTRTALLAGALLVGLCISAYIYLSVYEYAQYSMRGGGTAGSTGGLAYDYATNWSWSLWDSIALLVPGFYGIGGGTQNFYWGHMEPWTDAYVYVGLLPIMLTVLALVYRRTALAIFMAATTVLLILISLGRNFPLLYDLMFAVLPFFNKFRAPSMILHLLPFTLGILAAIGYGALEELYHKPKESGPLARMLMIVAAASGACLLLAFMLKDPVRDFLSSFLFLKDSEPAMFRQQYGAQAQQAIAFFKQQRFDIFWKDFVKFLALTAASAGVAAWYLRRSLGPALFGTVMVGLVLVDLAAIDSRLINPQPRQALEESFRPDATVAFLKQQPGLFRILPLPLFSESPWGDNTFAYHGIQSVGGYSPAKLKIYQTMLDSCMLSETDPSFPYNRNVMNMLNAVFVVVPGRLPEGMFDLVNVDRDRKMLTYRNPSALPRAWFVDSTVVAHSDHEVFALLNSSGFNPAHLAVVQSPAAAPVVSGHDSASASVTLFQSRKIVISASTPHPALLVVSEVYYPAGWKASVDGRETEIYRTNSVLRSVLVPAGTHEVTMTFDPPMYRLGYLLTNAGWVAAGLCVLAGLWLDPRVRARLRRRSPVTAA